MLAAAPGPLNCAALLIHCACMCGFCAMCCSVALEWMNRDEVRDALGAPSVAELNWQPCSDKLHYRTGPVSMLPVHKELVTRGVTVCTVCPVQLMLYCCTVPAV